MKLLVLLFLLVVCGLTFNPVTGAFSAALMWPALVTGGCALSYGRSPYFWTLVGLMPGIGLAIFLLTLYLNERKTALAKSNLLYPQMG